MAFRPVAISPYLFVGHDLFGKPLPAFVPPKSIKKPPMI
jgi:hypothetical protein